MSNLDESTTSLLERPSKLLTVAPYILICEFCERLAYYGFAGSLVLFFQNKLNMSNSDSDVQFQAWAGVCYLTPLIGGFIADKYLGRYNTIMLFCVIYLLGLVLVVVFSAPGAVNEGMFFLSMYIVALGTGGIKPNVSTMGADQFDDKYEQDLKEKDSFFNWFYWSINLGAFISYTTVTYVCQYGVTGLGGIDWSFFVGYMIPAIMMAAAIAIFWIGTPKYRHLPPQGSAIERAYSITKEAFYTRRHVKKENLVINSSDNDNNNNHNNINVFNSSLNSSLINKTHKGFDSSSGNSSSNSNSNDNEVIRIATDVNGSARNSVSLTWKSRHSMLSLPSDLMSLEKSTIHYLDKASIAYGGSYPSNEVESVKLVFRLFPFLGIMIGYWGIYSQMSTAFQNQGCQMDLAMSPSFNIPVSALNIFDTIAILIMVPIFEQYMFPFLKRYGFECNMLVKLGWGLVFAMLAMVVAGCVEISRKQLAPTEGNYYDKNARDHISACQSIDDYNPYEYQQWYAGNTDDKPAFCHQICSTTNNDSGQDLLSLDCISCDNIPQYSDLSVFWQIPQFMLIGISEILASITSLQFFYSQAPLSMKSVTQSLNLLMTALGSWLCIPLLLLVNVDPNNEWVPTNLDNGHLDSYFFLLAGLMVLNEIIFIKICQGYKYISTEELELVDNGGIMKSPSPSIVNSQQNALTLAEEDRTAKDARA